MSGATGSGWSGSGTILDPYGLDFDGINDNNTGPNIGSNTASGVYSHEIWIKTTSYGATYPFIFAEYASGGYPVVSIIELAGGTVAVVLYITATNYSILVGNSINGGIWEHIIATGDGTLIRLYQNNILNPVTTIDRLSPGLDTYQMGQSLNGPWQGSNSIVRIYPFALTPAQVAANFAAGPQASAGVWGDGVTPGAVLELVAAYGNAFVGG
jgi:hypothetical protein